MIALIIGYFVKKARKKGDKKKGKRVISIVSLLVNLFVVPGLGSLIGGKRKQGIFQIIIFLISIGVYYTFMYYNGIFYMMDPDVVIFVIIASVGVMMAYIWAVITSVQIIKEAYKMS